MEKPDITSAHYLMELNDLFEEVVNKLSVSIETFTNLKILIFDQLSKATYIKDTLSFENKLLKLRQVANNSEIDKLVNDYLFEDGKIRRLNYQRQQVEEKIMSLKKIFQIIPQ